MPALQFGDRCGCCFDRGYDSLRNLDCGHAICQECYEEQVETFRGKRGRKKRNEITCVMRDFADEWYNIDIVPVVEETGLDPLEVMEADPTRSLTSVVEDDDAQDQVDRKRLFIVGCRTCQNRVFKVKDRETLKAMPVMRGMDLVENATRPKPCETDGGHDTIVPDAKYYCMGCDKYICKECKQRFHRMMSTIEGEYKECNVYSLEVIAGKKGIGHDLFLRELTGYTGCGQHNGKEQTHFCRRCMRLACSLCILDSSTHGAHPEAVEELQCAVKQIKKQTKDDLDKLTDLYCKIETKKREINCRKDTKLKQFERMDADVDAFAAELVERIEKVRKDMKNEIARDRERCFDAIQKFERELEKAEVGVWTFGEAAHKIIEAGLTEGEEKTNQAVLVQKHLSRNREVFDALDVPEESITLKRLLGEVREFKQNDKFIDRIVPEALGRFAAICSETFMIHEHDMVKVNQQAAAAAPTRRQKPTKNLPVLASPSIAVIDSSRVAIADKAADAIKFLRSSPDEEAYKEGVTFQAKEPIGITSLGHGFVMILHQHNKLTLASNSGEKYPLPKYCGPNAKYKIMRWHASVRRSSSVVMTGTPARDGESSATRTSSTT